MNKELKINLYELCDAKKITILQLAAIVEEPYEEVLSWTKSIQRLSLHTAKKMAQYFDISLDKMLLDTQYPPINIDDFKENQFLLDKYMQIVDLDVIQEEINHKKTIKPGLIAKNKEDLSGINYRLRFARVNVRGIKLQDVAAKANVSWQLVQKWETIMPPAGILDYCILSMITRVSIDFLVYDDHPLEITSYNMNEDEYFVLNYHAKRLREKFITGIK